MRKIDYGNYVLIELFNGREIILLECRGTECVENSVIPLTEDNKFH